jgi:hypothetical protein
LFVDQVKGEMGRHVAHGERQQRPRLQAVIDASGIGVRHEVRQRHFRHPIRLTSDQRVRPVNRIYQTERGRGMMFGAPS